MLNVAIIGLGNRGLATLRRYAAQSELRVAALADLSSDNLAAASSLAPDADTYNSPDGWRDIAHRKDIDLMVVCTDWKSHTLIASHAMRCGRHVAIEVPAAMTLEEGDLLIATSRERRRHCIMLENCCYDPFTLGTIEIVRKGLLGEITHLDGAYIHNIADVHFRDAWWADYVANHPGNPYPTHAIGPIDLILRAAGGDRFASLYSAGTATGAINHTLITTAKGRTISLDYDTSTPRPYSRRQSVCGTLGFVEKYPVATLCTGELTLTGDEAMEAVCSHIAQPFRQIIEEGERLGVDNMMNYIMDTRLVQALQPGGAPDWTIEDSIRWCSITPLSELSAATGQVVNCPMG